MRIAAVLALLALLLVPRPSDACKCVHPSAVGAVKRAKVAFVAEITAIHPGKGGRNTRFELRVTEVFRGSVGEVITVEGTSSSCGLVTGGADAGETWLFVSKTGDLKFRQCDGSRRATKAVMKRLHKALGAGVAPS
jgi:hypothetical protein